MKQSKSAHLLCLITTIMLFIYMIMTLIVINGNNYNVYKPINCQVITTPEPIIKEVIVEKIIEVPIISYYDLANNAYFAKMQELECEDVDLQEWFLEYKQLTAEFRDYLELHNTLYDDFSEDEIYLIQRAVETEVYQCDFNSKVNVASVIFNRIADGRFGDTVKKIITNPGQFAWHRTKISESTILAVEYAYEIGDTTDGCIAFRSDRKPEKWGKWVYRFSDSAVHHFYSEED